MSANVLSARDISTQTQPASPEKKVQSMHRQRLEGNSKSENETRSQNTYISPSDNILSPATQKLSAFKDKRLGQKAKPLSFLRNSSASKDANEGKNTTETPDS